VLVVHVGHEGGGGGEHGLDKHEDGFLGGDLDPLADDVDELADGEVVGDEVSEKRRGRRGVGGGGLKS
jgi:hypothetical protein